MSETLYTRGSADEAYGANRRNIVGNRGGEGAKETKSVLQNIIQSDEMQGFLSPWKAIGKGLATFFGPVDEALNMTTGIKTLEDTSDAVRSGLDAEQTRQYIEQRREYNLERQREANPYGIGPGPLAAGLGAAEGAWSYGVARPASTGVMLIDPENPYYENGNVLNAVRDSWNRSEFVSFGQATIANELVNKTNPIGLAADALGLDQYDIYSDTDMALAQQNPFYQAATGISDAGLELGIPVPVIKPLRLAAMKKVGIRTTPITSQAELDLIRTEYIQHRSFVEGTDMPGDLGWNASPKRTGIGYQVYRIAETTNSDVIARNPLVKGVDGIDQVRLTEILARTDDPNTVFNILMGTRGDLRAIRELADSAPDTVWTLGDVRSTIFDNAANDIPYRPEGDALVKANQVFDSSASAMDFFGDVRNILVNPKTGSPYVATTRMPQGYLVERVRSATGDMTYKWNTGDFSNSPGWVRAIAESRFPGGPITHFMHFVAGKQPLGRVSRSSARPNDVMIEFDAMVNNVPLFRGNKDLEYGITSDGTILRMPANQWVAQQRQRLREGITDRNLQGVWREIEDDAVYTLAMTMGYSHDAAMDAVRQARQLRDGADDVINYLENSGGVLFSERGDRIVYSPETRSMLLDSFDTMDLLAVYDELNLRAPNNARQLLAAGNRIESLGGNVFDSLQRFFRSNVLLRLGYAPKNSIGEPWIASYIAHGTILTDEGLIPASKNFIKNRQNWARRQRYRADLMARVKKALRLGGETRGSLKTQLEQAVRDYITAREAYSVAAADLEAVKKGIVPPSKIPVVEQRAKSTLFEAQKLMDSIERTLDDQVPDWRQVVPPATITDVGDRLRELRAITGDDTSLIDDLYMERQEIILRADAEAMTPLRSIDAEIAGLTEEIHHLQDVITIHEAKLDHISVAAAKGVDSQTPRPTMTRVRFKDGSETVYYGDRRTVFERHYTPKADYRGWHKAPDRDYGAPLHNPEEMFPGIGTEKTAKFAYGDYTEELQKILAKVDGDPDAYVTVYRALPEGQDINPGDWVTPFKGYAETHAGDLLGDGWVIKKKRVRAGDVYTEGNSPAEWGWDPKYQDDVVEVEVLPGIDTNEVQMAVGRDLRGVSLQRQMDVATTKLDNLAKQRAKLLSSGVDNLRVSKMSVSDKARLEAIDAQLERILRFQTDEYAVSRLVVEPDDVPSIVDDVRANWGPDTDPLFFPQPRDVSPDVAQVIDAQLGQNEFSVQDSLRNIWNQDSSLTDIRVMLTEAERVSMRGATSEDFAAVQRIVRQLEDNGYDLGMQADPQSIVRQFAESQASGPDEAARFNAVIDELSAGYEGSSYYRVLGERKEKQRTYEELEGVLGTPPTVDDVAGMIRDRHYAVGQKRLEDQGYGPGDLITVWRTGSDETNNGVVAVTTEQGGLDNFAGEMVEYKVRRDRVLFDAIASREARDQQSLDPNLWTSKEKELGVHINDLVPVREMAPVLRTVDDSAAIESPAFRNVTGYPGGDRYAIVTDASRYKQTKVVRAGLSGRDAPTGRVKVDIPESSAEAIQMLPAAQAERLVQDLRTYATAKFFDSPAEVMEYLRVVDPDASDILVEDALRRTRQADSSSYTLSQEARDAVEYYTQTGYGQINTYLRDFDDIQAKRRRTREIFGDEASAESPDWQEATIRGLDEATQASVAKSDTVLYRGTGLPDDQIPTAGQTVSFPEYLSTTSDEGLAVRWTDGGGTVFPDDPSKYMGESLQLLDEANFFEEGLNKTYWTIEVPKGSRFADMKALGIRSDQDEFLLPRNSQLKVSRVEEITDPDTGDVIGRQVYAELQQDGAVAGIGTADSSGLVGGDFLQEVFNGNVPVHVWIDQFFDTYWDMRFKRTGAQRPDIGAGLSDANSPWWDIDPSEIALVRTGDDLLSGNNTQVYQSILDEAKVTDSVTNVYYAYGDISPSKGVQAKAEDPAVAAIRAQTQELQDMYDQAVLEVDRTVDTSADAMRAAEKKMAELEETIKDLTVRLGEKEAKIDSVTGNRVYYGSGRGKMTLNVNGKKFDVDGPLADDQYALGQQWAAEASAEGTTRFTYDPSFKASSRASRIVDGAEVVPIDRYDARYWDQLAYDINAHFRSDPLVGKILEGWSKKEVADWLRTPEGRAHAKSLGKDYLTTTGEYAGPVRGITIDQPVNVMIKEARDLDEIFDIVYAYIPNEDVRKWVANRQGTGVFDDGRNLGVSAGELKALLGGEDELSRVMSARGDWASSSFYQDAASNALDRLWQFIATMPEDRLARWPFFTREFRTQIENRARILDSQGVKLTLDDLQGLRQSARRASLRELEKTFYNIRRYNNAVYTSRFLMSFPGAFFNSLYRYGRFMAREPERMLTASLVAGDGLRVLATDAEGNEITERNIGDATWIVVPGTRQSEADTGLRFPVNSLATMVVDYPGLSFLMSYSVAEIVKQNPKNDERIKNAMGKVGAEDLYDEWFPFGPPSNPVSGFFGAWQKDFWRAARGPSDTDFIRASTYFYADSMAQWEKDGMTGEAPSFEQAVSDARAFYFSRSFLKNVNFLSVDRKVPGQLMRDAWYQHREQFPNDTAEARRTFMEEYGDWARWYTYSPSEYTTYLPASTEMYERVWEDYPDLVRKMVSMAGNDEAMNYIGLIALDVDNTFNPTVNNFMKNNPLPGDDVAVSRRITPERFANIVAVNDGWNLFTQYSVQYDAEMARLRDMRDNAITTEQQDYFREQIYLTEQEWKRWQREGPLGSNTAWQNDRSGNQDRATIAGNFLRMIVDDPKFAENEGRYYFWKDVKQFLDNEERAYVSMQKMRKNEDKANHRANFRAYLEEEIFPRIPEFRPVYERYFANRWDPNDESEEQVTE